MPQAGNGPSAERRAVATETAGLVSRRLARGHLGTAAEQIWRDHLLALACQQASNTIGRSCYVLVAPSGNPAWQRVADQYRAVLTATGAETFRYRSIEALLRDADDLLPHAADLRRRYLQVDTGTEMVAANAIR